MEEKKQHLWSEEWKKKLLEPDSLESSVKEIKKEGRTIVTLNGSFDLLHAGHLHIIYSASQQADVLILALNSDASIRSYKGESRPIISLENRLQMISSLGFVDYVTYFEESTPCSLLSIIKPDVHVNGAEYGKNCIEAKVVEENGGKLHIVELVPGLSTTEVIGKIKNS